MSNKHEKVSQHIIDSNYRELFDVYGMIKIWQIYKDLHCLPGYKYDFISVSTNSYYPNKAFVKLYKRMEKRNIRGDVMFEFNVDYTKFDEMIEIIEKKDNFNKGGDWTYTDIAEANKCNLLNEISDYEFSLEKNQITGVVQETEYHQTMNVETFDIQYGSTEMYTLIER